MAGERVESSLYPNKAMRRIPDAQQILLAFRSQGGEER
jgi:hypothetical protein